MPVTYNFESPETVVNQTTTAFQGNPYIVTLSNGSYVIVWNDESALAGDTDGSAVRAQVYAADGTALGSEFLINQQTAKNQYVTGATALSGGGFVVTWSSNIPGDTTSGDVKARIFTNAGAALGDEFMVPVATTGYQDGAILAGLQDGGLIAVWTDYGPSGTTIDAALVGQRFDANGSRVGDPFGIASYTDGSQYTPAITVLSDGRFVVSWTDFASAPLEPTRDKSSGGIQARLFSADSSPLGTQFAVNDLTSGLQSNSSIAALASGGFVVVWTDHLGDRNIHGRVFDSSGDPLAGSFVANQTTSGAQQEGRVVSWPDGGFMIHWSDQSATFGEIDSAVAARTFSDTGAPTGDEQRLNSSLTGNQIAQVATVLQDGTMVFAWASMSSIYDGSGAAVHQRRFSLEANTTGSGEVFGTNGNDLLSALDGGATLRGYGGNDQLVSANGNDTMIGGAGDDTYFVNGVGDLIIEDSSGGNDTVQSSISWALGHDLENLTLTGSNQLSGTGNAVANIIAGNAAASTLAGGAGNDRLVLNAAGSGSHIDGGADTDTLAVSGTATLSTLTAIEAIELTAGSNLTLTASQAMTGLAFNTAVSGSGAVTINMDAGVLLSITGFQGAVANPGITFTINGTVGTDAIKASHFSNTINGGAGQDQIRGGNAVDTIDGGTERDKIAGWGGADVLTGGGGNDQFRYLFASDSGIGALADRITDFTIGSDTIDFRLLDSDLGTPGVQNYAFSFIGVAAFTNGGGAQVRFADSGAGLLVQMDLDGNGVADMEIVLQGLAGQTMTAGDFLFV